MPLKVSTEKLKIGEFLSRNSIGVLATSNADNQPHAATIYFIVDPSLNAYFITKEKTTKVSNLKKNPQAALAVYEPVTQSTVQMSGTVTEVEDISRLDDIFRRILAVTKETSESSIPPVSRIKGGEYKCFCLHPESVRLVEYTKPDHNQEEGVFDDANSPTDKA